MRVSLMRPALAGALLVSVLSACAREPEPGSPEWCAKMKAKAQSEVSFNEADTFAEHCMRGDAA